MTLTPVAVERELSRLIAAAEDCARDLADRAHDAGQAEHAFKVGYARALLRADGAVAVREAQALLAVEDEHLARKIADARLLAAQEAGRMIRASLDALRSINTNVRLAIGSDGF